MEKVSPVRQLSEAAALGNMTMVSQLLAAGASPDVLVEGRTGSAATDQSITASDYRVTPLLRATLSNALPAAALLLEAGADPDLGDTDGMTPLMMAAGLGNVEAVQLLLSRGERWDLSQAMCNVLCGVFHAPRRAEKANSDRDSIMIAFQGPTSTRSSRRMGGAPFTLPATGTIRAPQPHYCSLAATLRSPTRAG